VRRVVDGEPNVGNAHRVERAVATPAFLPRGNELLAQHAKPLSGDGRQQGALVGEMAIERRARDAEPRSDVA
jgi:hypothetical protein